MTAAQILAMKDTAVTLVAAPGAGKTIVPLCVSYHLIFVSTYYTVTASSTYYSFGGVTLNQLHTLENVLQDQGGGGDNFAWDAAPGGIASTIAQFDNLPFGMGCISDNPTDGDSALSVTTTYLVADV